MSLGRYAGLLIIPIGLALGIPAINCLTSGAAKRDGYVVVRKNRIPLESVVYVHVPGDRDQMLVSRYLSRHTLIVDFDQDGDPDYATTSRIFDDEVETYGRDSMPAAITSEWDRHHEEMDIEDRVAETLGR